MTRKARLRVDQTERVVIPPSFRKATGIRAGDEVVPRLEHDELRIITLRGRIARAYCLARKCRRLNVNVSCLIG